jgi:uncharacterized protein
LIYGPREVAIVGRPDDAATRDLHRLALMGTVPGAVVAVGPEGSDVPLLRDRTMIDGLPTVYVCRHFTCDAPVTSPQEVAQVLRTVTPPA